MWEIKGASFSTSQNKTHTAAGISVRFPRIERMRSDKDYKSHTTLQEIIKIASLDPVSYVNNKFVVCLYITFPIKRNINPNYVIKPE